MPVLTLGDGKGNKEYKLTGGLRDRAPYEQRLTRKLDGVADDLFPPQRPPLGQVATGSQRLSKLKKWV